jgi:hypothetical protein
MVPSPTVSRHEGTLMTRFAARRWMLPILLLLLVILPACDAEDKPSPTAALPSPSPSPAPDPFIEDSLVFRHMDQSVIEMGDSTFTCCGLYDPGFANEPAIQIMFYDPTLQKNSWSIVILTEATTAGSVHTLPTKVVAPHKVPTVLLFVHGGEYSSEPDESSGTITLHSFECGASTTSVDFSVDATLHSEYWDGGQILAKGRFRAVFPRSACTP